MPRGRHHYDPIIQVPAMVEGEQDLSRIEVFMDENLKWWGRQVAADGSLTGNRIGDFDHDALLRQVGEAWPTLPIFELRNESDDSTWEGHGPSPRLWQSTGEPVLPAVPENPFRPPTEVAADLERAPEQYPRPAIWGQAPDDSAELILEAAGVPDQMQLRAIVAPTHGTYVMLGDILELLESWAVSFDVGKNPSGAVALREAVDALKDIG